MFRRALLPVFVSLLIVPAIARGTVGGQTAELHALEVNAGGDSQQFSFMRPLLKDVDVLSLAESIHMTHEFPLVRTDIVRWTNEQLSFGVLAIEGSPEDLWVSQDAFLRAPANLSGATSGLFQVWNTTEMGGLFAYERSTWSTQHPLYITAYDIQPGTGRESHGVRVFQLLRQTLTQYAAPPEGFDAAGWDADLGVLSGGCGQFRPEDEARVVRGIETLQAWIDRAAPNVERTFPNIPHAAALRLIPENLRASLALCKTVKHGRTFWDSYKPTRDHYAAEFTLKLRSSMPRQKLILWAHVSHLFYDSGGRNTSVGEILHAALGRRLYTIGTFAGGGGTIVLFSDVNDDLGYARVTGVSPALRRLFRSGCPEVCFVDLRGTAAGSVLSTTQAVWYESGPVPMNLALNFDGIVWVDHVHAPQLRRPLAVVLFFFTKHYFGWMMGALECLAFAVIFGWMVRRQRRIGSA